MPDPQDLLTALDPEQRSVATALRGPVCVVAGAGTGKTRAITHRIAYGVATGMYEPTEVLAVTYTTRAAGEMRTRLTNLGAGPVQARTFHSAALRQARYFWPQVYGTEFPEIVQSKFGLVASACRQLGLSADTALLRDLSAEIEWAKVSNVAPPDYAAAAARAHREVSLDAASIGNVLAAYEEVKRQNHRIDMEDILLVTAAILADDERVAAQVRRQYRWFVVDEFQDANPLQSTLLDLWLGGREDVCVVGDPRQTIYSFAGASPRILTGFTAKYPSAQRLELVRNYRSTPQVVSVANAVFGRSDRSGVKLQAQKPSGEPVRYLGHPDEPAEARAVAEEIVRQQRRGVPYREMAILYRVNAQSEQLEEALGERKIPFTLRGAEGFFQRAEVRQAVTLLRGAARGGQEEGDDLAADVRAILAAMDYRDTPPTGAGNVRARWESLHAIVTMASDMAEGADDSGPRPDLTALVADLDRRASVAHAPASDGVTLSTLHAAKGLEWDVVFCTGMHEGTLPSPHAQTLADVEEERRLFYVGLTRARDVLSVSWSRSRKPGGRGTRGPTRFLDALLPPDHESRRTGAPAPKRKTNAVVEELAPSDRDLFERLKQWRSEKASESSVPAYVIFTDATLLGIVDRKPGTSAELVGISGIGATKRERFGDDVLAIVEG